MGLFYCLIVAESLSWVLTNEVFDQHSERWRGAFERKRFSFEKGRNSSNHFVYNCPHSIKICRVTVPLVLFGLIGHVLWTSTMRIGQISSF